MADTGGTREELLAVFREEFASRNWSGALATVHRLAQMDPRDAQAWQNMGAVYVAMGGKDSARESFKRALEIDPKNALAHYNLGVLSSQEGNHDQAILHYQKAIGVMPDMVGAFMGLASSYFQLGDNAYALYNYSQAYMRAPQDAEVARSFGVVLMKMGQYVKAAHYLEQAVQSRPDWAEPYLDYGEAMRRLGRDREAMEALVKGLRMKQRPEGLVSLAFLHLKYGEPRRAHAHLHRALALSPGLASAHRGLGLCHVSEKNWTEAIKELREAHRCDSENLETALDLASALIESGQELAQAYSLASAVRMKDPDGLQALDVIGRCLIKQGRYDEAREELEAGRALMEASEQQDPLAESLYRHLAEVYMALNDSMMAAEMESMARQAKENRAALKPRSEKAPA